jgi:hypothetical protein
MLVLLLLPAVNAAREAARRNNCANAVRQLALGVLNRESATTRFPLAMFGQAPTVATSIDNRSPVPMSENDGYSWIVALLPYIEETAMYDQLSELTNQFALPVNTDTLKIKGTRSDYVQERPMDLVKCPSFPGEDIVQGRYRGLDTAQVTNYMALVAGCVDGSRQTYGDINPTWGGMLVTKQSSPKGLLIGEAKDGTSKTLLIGESKSELYSFWFSGRSASTVGTPPDAIVCSRIRAISGGDGFNQLTPEIPSALNYGRRYDAPADTTDPWFAQRFPPGEQDWGPSSAHSGDIVNHGYCDGHVKGISAGTDATVYFRLITRAGGEPAKDS